MAIREFCDRCGEEVTGKVTGAFQGIDDADRDGNGTTTDSWDILCQSCYSTIKAFINTKKTRRRATTTKEADDAV